MALDLFTFVPPFFFAKSLQRVSEHTDELSVKQSRKADRLRLQAPIVFVHVYFRFCGFSVDHPCEPCHTIAPARGFETLSFVEYIDSVAELPGIPSYKGAFSLSLWPLCFRLLPGFPVFNLFSIFRNMRSSLSRKCYATSLLLSHHGNLYESA